MLLDDLPFDAFAAEMTGAQLRTPLLDRFGDHDFASRRALIIGSCLANYTIRQSLACSSDLLLFNGGVLQDLSGLVDRYDFVLLQVPLRAIVRDGEFWDASQADPADAEALLEQACARLDQYLDTCLRHVGQRPAFVCNFIAPVLNPAGKLLPRYDTRNLMHLVQRLNEHLEARLQHLLPGRAHVLDTDAIAATIGKRHLSDEFFNALNHAAPCAPLPPGAVVPEWNEEEARFPRFDPMPAIQRHWPAPDAHLFGEMIANEVRAMWSTAHAANRIKLLVVDLDNTLWRGVLSEEIEGRAGQVSEAVNQRFYRQFGVADGSLYRLVEGWPYALMEALHWCKARGIVLAIASKNNEADTLANLQQAYNGLVDPASFVSVKINWRPKAENMREILQETNLLPGNVLFIDDNPLERQQMEAAYPDMLIMGRWMGYAKSVLHHSVLAQVPRVSDESARRTDMLKGSVAGRRALHAADAQPGDSGAALAAMAIRAQVDELPRALDGSAAARALELLNKTNQFNLNGTRLSADALDQALGQGCRWFSLAVSDRYTEHGLVGVAIVNRNGILVQWALSCRVLGLQVEAAFLQRVRQRLAREHLVLLYRPTERNFPLQAWMAAATAVVDGVHRLPAAPMPAHVAMTDTPDHAEGVDPGHDPMPEARRTPFPPSAATA